MRFALWTCIVLVLASCGSDPRCEIEDNGDGTRTVSCPGADPIRVAAGAGVCTITEHGEDDKVISCQNGDSFEIRDGQVVFPGYGTISGAALRYGVGEHAGIRIYVETADIEAFTDEDGRYEIELPAGIHDVRFEDPGRTSQRVTNVPVIRDDWDMGVVVLRKGRQVAEVGEEVLVSPDQTAITSFALQGDRRGGWLHLSELDEARVSTPLRLGSYVMHHEFDPEGRKLLYQERTAIDGPLRLLDRDTGETVTIASNSMDGRFVLGGQAVVYEARHEDGRCELHLWRMEDGSRETITACERLDTRGGPPILGADAAGSVLVYEDDEQIAWALDLATGASTQLVEDRWIERLQILPGGHLLFSTTDAAQTSWFSASTSDSEVRSIGKTFALDPPLVDPTGAWAALPVETSTHIELRVHEIASGTNHPVTQEWDPGFAFSPNGRYLLWAEDELPQVLDLGAPDTIYSWPGLPVGRAEFSGVGAQVVALDELQALVRWDPIRNSLEQIDPAGTGWFWNEDRTRLFAGVAGGTLHLDLLDGTTARSELELNHPPLETVAWEQDGPGVFFGRTVPLDDGTTEWLLYRWDPREEPEIIHRGRFGKVVAGPGAVTAFVDEGGPAKLMFHQPGQEEPEEVDGPLDSSWGVHLVGDLLLYQLDAGGSAQAGAYVIGLGPAGEG